MTDRLVELEADLRAAVTRACGLRTATRDAERVVCDIRAEIHKEKIGWAPGTVLDRMIQRRYKGPLSPERWTVTGYCSDGVVVRALLRNGQPGLRTRVLYQSEVPRFKVTPPPAVVAEA